MRDPETAGDILWWLRSTRNDMLQVWRALRDNPTDSDAQWTRRELSEIRQRHRYIMSVGPDAGALPA